MALALPAQDYLLKRFSYDPQTGELRWRAARCEQYVGSVVGCLKSGYRVTHLNGQQYRIHRIIWKMMTGQEPKEHIDHKDRDPTNNRWCNLREATNSENSRNTKKHVKNTSGVKGVYWHRLAQKWAAHITVDYEVVYLGLFSNIADAALTRQLAAERLHGAFARGE